ncbi:MAG: hypothetical protein WCW77_00045 [Patescibacteria group bacterium]|jgi:hypothetical protein
MANEKFPDNTRKVLPFRQKEGAQPESEKIEVKFVKLMDAFEEIANALDLMQDLDDPEEEFKKFRNLFVNRINIDKLGEKISEIREKAGGRTEIDHLLYSVYIHIFALSPLIKSGKLENIPDKDLGEKLENLAAAIRGIVAARRIYK